MATTSTTDQGTVNVTASRLPAQPTTTGPIPNPMHQFASWTYAVSLWWLSIDDYNVLQQATDINGISSNWPSTSSYVVAEDSGLYTNRRSPQQVGLNYNIEEINFETVVGLNTTTKSSNLVNGEMVIVEPYGLSFMDSLVQMSYNGQFYENYLTQPYMLQIEFTGYDDAGNPIPTSQTGVYRKRFPIKLSGVKVNVTGTGSRYTLSFYAIASEPGYGEYGTTPKEFTVKAGTVGDFFDANIATSFTSQINSFFKNEVTTGRRQLAPSFKFDIDPEIYQSTIVNPENMSLAQASQDGDTVSLTKSSFIIPYGTNITDLINRVMTQSSFIPDQLGITTGSKTQASLEQALSCFKTITTVDYVGVDGSGAANHGHASFDNILNRHTHSITYRIYQYPVYDVPHPNGPFLIDSRPATVKAYNYIYTGQNTDIIDLKIDFDTTWYVAVAAYANQYSATQPSPGTSVQEYLASAGIVMLSPQYLASVGLANNSALGTLGKIPNLNPLRYKPVIVDKGATIGLNNINAQGQNTSSLLKSIYSKLTGDMVNINLDIVGDPTLLKQDEVLFSPATSNTSSDYWTMTPYNYAKKYGVLPMDTGQLIASLEINTPLDIDTDWPGQNAGLVFPRPGLYTSQFSGQYKIITINNKFSRGVFTQALNMVKIMSDAYIDASQTASNSSRANSDTVTNQQTSGITTPASATSASSTSVQYGR